MDGRSGATGAGHSGSRMTRRQALAHAALVFTLLGASGCNDCHYCDARLDITVDGLPAPPGYLGFDICDGDFCAEGSLPDSGCVTVPRLEEGGFEVCSAAGELYAGRRQLLGTTELPVPNPPVAITVTDESGRVLADFEGTPRIRTVESCLQPCEWREISF